MVEISIYSDEARRVINGVVDDALAARPSLSPNQRRGRPVLQGGNSPEKLVAEITRVINGSSGQPKYDARGLRRPGVTVTNQTPFFRDTDSSVFINPSLVGDECELFKDTEGVWRLGVAHEFKATADCQAVAGSRNNMAVTIITTTPASALPITADLVLADTTLGNITLTLPEEEVGKRVAVCNIGNTRKIVTLTNEFYGVDGLIIRSFKSTVDGAYTGVTDLGWVIT